MNRKRNRGVEFKGPNAIISQIAKIRERLNRLIIQELREHQIEGIVTSHGDILSALFKYDELSMQETADLIDRDKSTIRAVQFSKKVMSLRGFAKQSRRYQGFASSKTPRNDNFFLRTEQP